MKKEMLVGVALAVLGWAGCQSGHAPSVGSNHVDIWHKAAVKFTPGIDPDSVQLEDGTYRLDAGRILLALRPLELLVPLISHTPLLKLGLQGAYLNSVAEDRELLALITRPARRPTAARALRGMSLGMALRSQATTAPALLHALQRPLLLIWGREDRFVPLSIGETIGHQHPAVELEVLDGCGHCPHDEVPERFISVLMPWLDRNLGDIRPAGDKQRR